MTTVDSRPGADLSSGPDSGGPLSANVDQPEGERRGVLATVWSAVSAVIGALMGLVPHVLHHAGLIAGAALVTGVGGNLLFGVVGLVFSIPLLRRLYRRFHTWRAPAIALAAFAVMFSVSAFVLGPAISADSPADTPAPSQSPTAEHSEHH